MRKIEASGLDLNLLVALQQLIKHQQVAAAAYACGVTPSAMSRSLMRLRKSLGDPLLTPLGRSLIPTNRVLALMPELDDILSRIDKLSRPSTFDPRTSDRAFRIACTDYETGILIAPLLKQFRQTAPGVRVHLLNGGDRGVEALENQAAELGLLSPDGDYPWAKRRLLLKESFVTLVPKSALPLTRQGYLSLAHVVVATEEPIVNPVDARLGSDRRHIACRARSFASAIDLACAAHCAFNVPTRLIRDMKLPKHMAVVEPVISVPHFEVAMYWHLQTDTDPGMRWIRSCIAALAASIQTQPLPLE
ncbi:LysR substrate-binding domain-containing protein [Roseateles sp.]|uniref:LysR family transcriptional regulator n=1 Tax=Roseateles sp. TaxID=1971397 RepID=UPI003D124D9E